MKRVGLALGGGGAKGMAHIPLLEVFDEMGVVPSVISGTSIGAIIGAFYASGLSAKQIKAVFDEHVADKDETWLEAIRDREISRTLKFFDVDLRHGGLLKGDKIVRRFGELLSVDSFDELKIPLKIVAADYYKSEEVVIESGDLLSAIRASMGLPGIFTPVKRDDRILIDGGAVNPVPYDLLDDVDIVVAIDILGEVPHDDKGKPNMIDAVLNTITIMQRAILDAKMEMNPPDIYLKLDTTDVDLLDFPKGKELFNRCGEARKSLRHQLAKALQVPESKQPFWKRLGSK